MLSFQASNGTTAVLSIKEMSKEATHHARTYELSHIAVLLAVIALNLILGFIQMKCWKNSKYIPTYNLLMIWWGAWNSCLSKHWETMEKGIFENFIYILFSLTVLTWWYLRVFVKVQTKQIWCNATANV